MHTVDHHAVHAFVSSVAHVDAYRAEVMHREHNVSRFLLRCLPPWAAARMSSFENKKKTVENDFSV